MIPCTPGYRRLPSATFRGRTAKAISVDILEKTYVSTVCFPGARAQCVMSLSPCLVPGTEQLLPLLLHAPVFMVTKPRPCARDPPPGQSFGPMCTHLEHANYLGREFQRAEMALQSGQAYVQD